MGDNNTSKTTMADAKAKLEALQSAHQTLPTRFARQAEALTAELVAVKNTLNKLNTSINDLCDEAQTALGGTSPNPANTHQFTAKEVQQLINNFTSLNLRIEKKQDKDKQYLRIWKPIYNLFRSIFGKERKLTQLTRQQNLAYPIFMKINEAIVEKLQLEGKQMSLKDGLDFAVVEQNKAKDMLSSIQETLRIYQIGKTMRPFVSDDKKSVAFVAKALDRFLTKATEEKRDALIQTMKDHPEYIKGPDKFLQAIDKARKLYEEVETADKPAHVSSLSFKKHLAHIKPDEDNAPNQHKKK